VVCYFADGSEEFTVMTAVALRSFLLHTPLIHAGLLTPDRATRDRILAALPPSELGRVECRLTDSRGHLAARWNATQFKLDIQQWAHSHYDTFVWMDSDTLVFDDLTPFLLRFIKAEDKLVYLVKDHAMSDDLFVAKWRQIAGPFSVDVPQACIMAFKRPILVKLFDAWKSAWNEWITPTPFARLGDPASGAPHSAFCIEQYALALALSRCALGKDILWFARGSLDVTPTAHPARPQLGERFVLVRNFSEVVERRWQNNVGAQPASLHEDAATAVRFRPGGALSSYGAVQVAGAINSSYLSSYLSSYSSSYSSSYGPGGAAHGAQVLRRVEGIPLEPAPAPAAAPTSAAAPAAPSSSLLAWSAPSIPDGEALPSQVRVDVFAGAVYHVYSRWFFYVLHALSEP
jgi:hypothetical protein